jgi:hypothetical protein
MNGESPRSPGNPMKTTCGAKTRAGTACEIAPVAGRTRCRLHGGATPRGPAIGPAFKHGRYSLDLPTRLAARYAESQIDPELASLRDDLALVHTRITEVLSQLGEGVSESRAREAWREICALVERKRRLAESEARRLVLFQQMITTEQAVVLVASLVDVVHRHVHDRATLTAIQKDLASIWEADTRR